MKYKKCTNPECENAGQLLPLDEFTTQNQSRDGKASRCKTCFAKYRKTNSAKTSSRKYRQSKKGRAARTKAAKKHRENNPEKKGAHNCVGNAVRRGKILPPSVCECADCSNQAEDFHHQNGYDLEHALDVVPLCKRCHRDRHRLIKPGE